MDWLFAIAAALMTVGPLVLVMFWLIRRGQFRGLVAAAAAAAGAAWWIYVYLVASGAGDLGGVMDCYPDCSASQEIARGILGYFPMAMGAVLLLVFLVPVAGRLRRAGS